MSPNPFVSDEYQAPPPSLREEAAKTLASSLGSYGFRTSQPARSPGNRSWRFTIHLEGFDAGVEVFSVGYVRIHSAFEGGHESVRNLPGIVEAEAYLYARAILRDDVIAVSIPIYEPKRKKPVEFPTIEFPIIPPDHFGKGN